MSFRSNFREKMDKITITKTVKQEPRRVPPNPSVLPPEEAKRVYMDELQEMLKIKVQMERSDWRHHVEQMNLKHSEEILKIKHESQVIVTKNILF